MTKKQVMFVFKSFVVLEALLQAKLDRDKAMEVAWSGLDTPEMQDLFIDLIEAKTDVLNALTDSIREAKAGALEHMPSADKSIAEKLQQLYDRS